MFHDFYSNFIDVINNMIVSLRPAFEYKNDLI